MIIATAVARLRRMSAADTDTDTGTGTRHGSGSGSGARTGTGSGFRFGVNSRDQGISTIEVVILAPVMILFILVLVAFGQMVDARGSLDAAARDAAQAGSLRGSLADAQRQAMSTARQDLHGICLDHTIRMTTEGTSWTPEQGIFAVQITCRVRGLKAVGLGIQSTMKGEFSSPWTRIGG